MKKTAIVMMVMAMVAGLFATPMSAKAAGTFLNDLAKVADDEGYKDFAAALRELDSYGVECVSNGYTKVNLGGPYPYTWVSHYISFETGECYTMYVYGNATDATLYPERAYVVHDHNVCEHWSQYEWEELK